MSSREGGRERRGEREGGEREGGEREGGRERRRGERGGEREKEGGEREGGEREKEGERGGEREKEGRERERRRGEKDKERNILNLKVFALFKNRILPVVHSLSTRPDKIDPEPTNPFPPRASGWERVKFNNTITHNIFSIHLYILLFILLCMLNMGIFFSGDSVRTSACFCSVGELSPFCLSPDVFRSE